MRWLIIVLLVSLGALLLAAAGLARHIWLQHANLRRNPNARAGPMNEPAEEHDNEPEP